MEVRKTPMTTLHVRGGQAAFMNGLTVAQPDEKKACHRLGIDLHVRQSVISCLLHSDIDPHHTRPFPVPSCGKMWNGRAPHAGSGRTIGRAEKTLLQLMQISEGIANRGTARKVWHDGMWSETPRHKCGACCLFLRRANGCLQNGRGSRLPPIASRFAHVLLVLSLTEPRLTATGVPAVIAFGVSGQHSAVSRSAIANFMVGLPPPNTLTLYYDKHCEASIPCLQCLQSRYDAPLSHEEIIADRSPETVEVLCQSADNVKGIDSS